MGLRHVEVRHDGPPILSEKEWWAEDSRPVRLYASSRLHPFSTRRRKALLALAMLEGIGQHAPEGQWERATVLRQACMTPLHKVAFGPRVPEYLCSRMALAVHRFVTESAYRGVSFRHPYPAYAVWGLCGPRGPWVPEGEVPPRLLVDAWITTYGEPPGICKCSECMPAIGSACKCARAAIPSPFAGDRFQKDETAWRLACRVVGEQYWKTDKGALPVLADRLEETGNQLAAEHLRLPWPGVALWPIASVMEAWHGS